MRVWLDVILPRVVMVVSRMRGRSRDRADRRGRASGRDEDSADGGMTVADTRSVDLSPRPPMHGVRPDPDHLSIVSEYRHREMFSRTSSSNCISQTFLLMYNEKKWGGKEEKAWRHFLFDIKLLS
jgi:hypothetical protein